MQANQNMQTLSDLDTIFNYSVSLFDSLEQVGVFVETQLAAQKITSQELLKQLVEKITTLPVLLALKDKDIKLANTARSLYRMFSFLENSFTIGQVVEYLIVNLCNFELAAELVAILRPVDLKEYFNQIISSIIKVDVDYDCNKLISRVLNIPSIKTRIEIVFWAWKQFGTREQQKNISSRLYNNHYTSPLRFFDDEQAIRWSSLYKQ